jgi:hypothetical protein
MHQVMDLILYLEVIRIAATFLLLGLILNEFRKEK